MAADPDCKESSKRMSRGMLCFNRSSNSFLLKFDTVNSIIVRSTGELPSFFVHGYFPLVHLWPFQSLLFYGFLFPQAKHYVQQDLGERPKMKTVTLSGELLYEKYPRLKENHRYLMGSY